MTINTEYRTPGTLKNLIVGAVPLFILAISVAPVSDARAQAAVEHPSPAHEAAYAAAVAQTLTPDAQAATAVVDQFAAALKKGDMATVKALLDPEVLILESGSAERNRDEYLGHHAVSDALFLGKAHVEVVHRTTRRSGDLAWVGSESEIHTRKDDTPLTLLSTETMVLKKVGEDWRIVHIHWSSRPK